MALLLHRIGRFAFRRAWLVIVAWALALAGILGAGIGLGGQLQESYAIPGTESQAAIDQLAAVFPQTAGASAKAVVEAPHGASVESEPYRSAITGMEAELEEVDGVASVLGPFDEYAGDQVSGDARTAYIQVQFDGPTTDVTVASIDAVTATGDTGRDAGLTVAFGGEVFQDTTFGLTITEVFGVLFAGVVLLITFGSLLSAGMPLLTALVGVGAAFGGISLVAAFATVSSTAPMLAVMIGLAVGIDYALFILSRHRTQLARGQDPAASAAEALATAGGAVVFAGLTVIIALLGLLVVGIPFLSVMGISAAFAVLVAVLGAVTLLPALLGVFGRRLVPKPGSRAHRRANADDDSGKRTLGRRWVDLVLKAPVVFVVLVVGLLGAAAIPAASLDLNLPSGASEPEGSTQREAFEMIENGFGPGYNGPLIVTVDITQTTDIHRDHPGHPRERARRARDEGGRRTHSRARARDRRRLRHADRGHWLHRRDHRHLQPPERCARAVRAHRRRPVDPAAPARVPLDLRAGEGRARLPALGIRCDRGDGGDLPVGVARRAHARPAGSDPELPPDPAARRVVRPRDGLRGVPRLGNARGVREDP
jgi:putative drug exporter of the RND superfamily